MMSESLRTIGGRHVLRIERRLAHAPDKVWRALTEPVHLGQWFPSRVELEPRVGGQIRFVFEHGEGPPGSGVISEFDPPRRLAYTWGRDEFRYELHPAAGGCRLVFTHTFDDRAGAASFATGWQVCLDALERVLDGKPAEVTRDTGELHEQWIDRLGLDAGQVEDTADGWVARLERQLVRPVATVWGLLGPAPAVGELVPAGFRLPGLPAGAVTAVQVPERLEYESPAGRVRWDFTAGTGHGARLILTVTGTPDQAGQRSNVLAAVEDRVRRLARQLAEA